MHRKLLSYLHPYKIYFFETVRYYMPVDFDLVTEVI